MYAFIINFMIVLQLIRKQIMPIKISNLIKEKLNLNIKIKL
jgi:hypothetical protein